MILIHGILGDGIDEIDLRVLQSLDFTRDQRAVTIAVGMGIADDESPPDGILFSGCVCRFPDERNLRLLDIIS